MPAPGDLPVEGIGDRGGDEKEGGDQETIASTGNDQRVDDRGDQDPRKTQQVGHREQRWHARAQPRRTATWSTTMPNVNGSNVTAKPSRSSSAARSAGWGNPCTVSARERYAWRAP